MTEQVEPVLDTISGSFDLRFPAGTLDEIVRLEDFACSPPTNARCA
jgi:hypothetical protein